MDHSAAMRIAVSVPVLLAALAGAGAAVERTVPFDSTGVIEEVGPELRSTLGLWPGQYPRFKSAMLLVDPDSNFTLQVYYRDAAGYALDRRPLTKAETKELLASVRRLIAERAPQAVVGSAPRAVFLGASTLTSLGFYSWALPVAAELHGKSAVAASLFASGAGFLGPFLATRRHTVTGGMAELSIYGMTRGVAHGALLRRASAGREQDERYAIGWAFAGSLIEGTAGCLWAYYGKLDLGQAHAIAAAGDIGLASAGEAAAMVDAKGDGRYGSLLAGSALGVAAGSFYGRSRHPTWGDVEIVRMGWIVGQGAGAAIWNTVSDEGDDLFGAATLGGIGGFLLADHITAARDYRATEAILVDLGTIAGGALALGVAVLAVPEDARDVDIPIALAAAAGGCAGYALTCRAFAGDATSRAAQDSGRLLLSVQPWIEARHHEPIGLTVRASW